MATQRSRAEVPAHETWNLDDLFPSTAAWEAELAAVPLAAADQQRWQGHLGEGASTLLAALDGLEVLGVRIGRAYAFAQFQMYTDGTDPSYQAMVGQVQPLITTHQALEAALRSELLQLPAGTLERYQAAEPSLAVHRMYLKRILADKEHALHPAAEAALAAMGESLNGHAGLFMRTTSADLTCAPATTDAGESYPVTVGGYLMAVEPSPDTQLRRSAWDSLVKGLKPYENTLAYNLASQIRKDVLTARLRKYGSALEMRLSSGYGGPQGISVEVFDQTLDVIQTEVAPHMRRLAKLRQRVLGLDKLQFCDLQASLDSSDVHLSWAEGQRLIVDATAALGAEYQAIHTRAFAERWIDRADNIGKPGMAFCAPIYGVHPYVFSTWSGNFRMLFILGHELGHAAHGQLTMQNQQPANAGSPLLFVEAPSTMNELLLARHIRQTGSPAMVRQALLTILLTYHHNFVTHLLEAELLRRLYRLSEQDVTLTAKVLGDQTVAVLQSFWGDALEIDDSCRLHWMRQPHYYMGLYAHTYAVGLAGATAAMQNIEQEGAPAAARWIAALKSGSNQDALELFSRAGVDMSTAQPLRQAVAYVGQLVTELEASFA